MTDKIVQSPEGTVRESLTSLCTDATAIQIAKEIVEEMKSHTNPEQLEYDFHIQGNTGQMNVSNAYAEKNTWFKFDAKKESLINKVKTAEFEADCNISEYEFIDGFHRKVCDAVLSMAKSVEEVLREKMFKGKKTPINLIAVTLFEIVDFGDIDDNENVQITVNKEVPESEVDISPSVSGDLFKTQIETGKSFEEIVKEKKEAGDPAYKYVTGVSVQKMLWQCQIDMFVDYSSDKPLGEQDTDVL